MRNNARARRRAARAAHAAHAALPARLQALLDACLAARENGEFQPDLKVAGVRLFHLIQDSLHDLPPFVFPPAFRGWNRGRVTEIRATRGEDGKWTVHISASREFTSAIERMAYYCWERCFREDVRRFGGENLAFFMLWDAAYDLLLWQNLARQLAQLRALKVGVPRRPARPRPPRATD